LESSSVHHQEFFHCTHSNGTCHTGLLCTACEQNHDGTQTATQGLNCTSQNKQAKSYSTSELLLSTRSSLNCMGYFFYNNQSGL